jgi:hypothetical protein
MTHILRRNKFRPVSYTNPPYLHKHNSTECPEIFSELGRSEIMMEGWYFQTLQWKSDQIIYREEAESGFPAGPSVVYGKAPSPGTVKGERSLEYSLQPVSHELSKNGREIPNGNHFPPQSFNYRRQDYSKDPSQKIQHNNSCRNIARVAADFLPLPNSKATFYSISHAVVWVGFVCKGKGYKLLISASSSDVKKARYEKGSLFHMRLTSCAT